MKRVIIHGFIASSLLGLALNATAVPRSQRALQSNQSVYKQLRDAPVSLSVDAEISQNKNKSNELNGYAGEMAFGFGYALDDYGNFSFTPKVYYSANDTDGTVMNLNEIVYDYGSPSFLNQDTHGIAASLGLEYVQDISESNQNIYGEFSAALNMSRSIVKDFSISWGAIYWIKNRSVANTGDDDYGFVYKVASKLNLTKNFNFGLYVKYYDSNVVGGKSAQKIKVGPGLNLSLDQNVSLGLSTSLVPQKGVNGEGLKPNNRWENEMTYTLAVSISVF